MSKNMRHMAPQNLGKTLSRLFGYFKFYKVLFIFGILFTIIGSLGGIFFNAMLSPIIDMLVLDYQLPVFVKYLAILAGITGLLAIGQYLGTLFMGRLAQNIVHKIHEEMFVNMEKLPMNYF